MPFAPEVLSLHQLRQIEGLADLRNEGYEPAHPDIHPELTELSPGMAPAIEQVADNVYNARGFDPANTTFVVGDEGVVVIDAMTVADTAEQAMLAFREICDKPVKAVVYTHDHGDHVFGAPAFVDPVDVASGDVAVIAHKDLVAEIGRLQSQNFAVMGARALYHTGALLPEGPEGRVHIGVGRGVPFSGAGTLIPPNVLVDDELRLDVAGVRMELMWIPSEANTEIGVWLPDHGVLQTAECVQGECYPNVYTIRGDVPRPAQRWVDALDRLRAYPADALAKSHGRCIVGRDDAADHLLAYRDSIAWMHDQTVRLMNKGFTPDQIVERLGELPEHLAAHRHCGNEGSSLRISIAVRLISSSSSSMRVTTEFTTRGPPISASASPARLRTHQSSSLSTPSRSLTESRLPTALITSTAARRAYSDSSFSAGARYLTVSG